MAVGTKLVAYKAKVTTAATRVQLEAGGANGSATNILIQASTTNTGEVVIGGSTVVAKAGSQASPERVGVGLAKGAYMSIDITDPAAIWMDAETSKDGISYFVTYA